MEIQGERDISTESTPYLSGTHILYTQRWLVLAIFSLITMTNEIIWISLSSVASIVKEYYQVSYTAVNWLAMVFSLVYIFVVLSVFVLNKYGLKATIVAGALCNTIASALRLCGYSRNGYVLALIGTAIGGVGQCFLIFIPPTLAATWFGELERAKASAVGMLMNMLGVAIGFLMGSMFVPNVDDYDGAVKRGMFTTLLIQTIICCVLLLASLLFIPKAPPTPPSHSQAIYIERKSEKEGNTKKGNKIEDDFVETNDAIPERKSTGFFKNCKFLMKHSTFHLLTQAYGICFGLFAAVNTVVNSMCIQHFKGQEKLIGTMGFTSVFLGVIAMMIAGIWIDKTHKYKSLSIAAWVGCVVTFLAFTISLRYSERFSIVFVCFCAYGFCSYPYLSIGLEYAAEIMYPIKESILSFILLFVGCMYGVALTYIIGFIIDIAGADVAGYVTTGLYLIGAVCVAMIKGELERLKVDVRSPQNLTYQQ